jgi:hypothetical protein
MTLRGRAALVPQPQYLAVVRKLGKLKQAKPSSGGSVQAARDSAEEPATLQAANAEQANKQTCEMPYECIIQPIQPIQPERHVRLSSAEPRQHASYMQHAAAQTNDAPPHDALRCFALHTIIVCKQRTASILTYAVNFVTHCCNVRLAEYGEALQRQPSHSGD